MGVVFNCSCVVGRKFLVGPFQWIVGIVSNYSVDKRYNRVLFESIENKNKRM